MTNKNGQDREAIRENALKNFKDTNLKGLAVPHLVNTNSNYGESDNNVSEQYLYSPAFNSDLTMYDPESGEEVNMVQNALVGSRTGSRYSGSITESGLMQQANQVMQQSLVKLKVSDVAEMIGYDGEVPEDAYIEDLDEETMNALIGTYMSHSVNTGLSSAYEARAQDVSSGLEDILNPQEE